MVIWYEFCWGIRSILDSRRQQSSILDDEFGSKLLRSSGIIPLVYTSGRLSKETVVVDRDGRQGWQYGLFGCNAGQRGGIQRGQTGEVDKGGGKGMLNSL